MTQKIIFKPDAKLDLKLERIIDLPPRLVWKAWTTPELLKAWFCPAPWKTVECEIDLRPGGKFYTVMCSPEGEEHSTNGCYLEVVENERLVWTDAFGPGYRPSFKPNDCINGFFTAAVLLEAHETGTRYTVVAVHGDEKTRKSHEERGFYDGWGKALDQLVSHVKSLK